MKRRRIALVGGGVRSGKSAFALALARARGTRRAFVATAQALDAEMEARIAEHARTRGSDFTTVEEPLALPAVLERLGEVDVVVVDCLTLWLSNLLIRDVSVAHIEREVGALTDALNGSRFDVVLVTNEVGMGVVPESSLGRAFRDLAGRTHQRLASVSDEIYLAVLGVVLRLRPDPVSVSIHMQP